MPPQATPFAFLLKEGIADSKPSIRPLVGVVSLLRTTLARGWLKRCFADLGGESAPVSDTLDLLFFIGGRQRFVCQPEGGVNNLSDPLPRPPLSGRGFSYLLHWTRGPVE